MPSKEKILLVIVAAAVAGVAALDRSYDPVKLPATRAPADVPAAPPGAAPVERSPRPAGRSLLEPYSDLVSPELVTLEPIPVPPLPTALPPVRPWVHMDAAGGLRHFLFDPAEAPAAAGAGDAGGGTGEGAGEEVPAATPPEGGEAKKEEAAPVDLSRFDWVILKGAAGFGRVPGHIEILEKDREAGRTKYDLLVDPSMEFTFQQVNQKDGKPVGSPAAYRERCEDLGFSDTIENNYSSRRRRMEAAAGRADLDIPRLRELVQWSMDQAKLPKYPRRAAWTRAAGDLREIVRRTPDDKEAVKDLGRVLRLLQDFEAEVVLYDWWLERQTISKDPEILALAGEGLELLGLRDRARERYEEGLVTNPDPKVRLRLAEILVSTGSLEDARKAADAFARAAQDGERVAGAVGEARARLALGEIDAADRILLEKVSSSDRDAGWYLAAGAVHYARGKLEEALGHFQAAAEKAGPGAEAFSLARTNVAMARARLGANMAEGDAARKAALDAAVKAAEEALRDDPLNYYWPLVARAYALRAGGLRDRAIESLQEAVAAWPSEPYGRYLLGEFLFRDGRTAEARTQFLECSRLAPGFPDGLGGVGRCGGGEAGEAKDYLRRAAELEPRTAIWLLLAGRMAVLDEALPVNQRLEEAAKDLARLLDSVDRNYPYALLALGWVRYYQGDADEALRRWNDSLRQLNNYRAASPREQALVDQVTEWLRGSIQKVQKWQMTKIWRDDFHRPDGTNLGNGWAEDEKGAVKITLKDGAAQFGPGRIGAGETPGFRKEWEAPRVLKAVAEIHVDPADPCQFDTWFWMPQGKNVSVLIGLRKTEAGEMKLLFKKDPKTTEVQMVQDLGGARWPEDGRVTFAFVKMTDERGSDERGVVRIEINGKAVAGYEKQEIQQFVRTRGGKLQVEFRCTAMAGAEVVARVEAVEVWLDTQ